MKPEPQQHLIAKANLLVEASYRLTLAEHRFLLAALVKIESHPECEPLRADVGLRISAGDIAEAFPVTQHKAYDLLKDAVDRLAERWITIEAPDPEVRGLLKTRTRWVSAITYLPEQGQVLIYVAPKVIPYLCQLAGQFTRYQLANVAPLTSVYAIRLYELLAQWQSTGTREVRIDWLKGQFQIPDSYARVGDLKRWVIAPAVQQINDHSNLWVRYTQRKAGRTVVAFAFEFGRKPAAAKPDPAPSAAPKRRRQPSESDLAKFARPGESREAALARWFARPPV